MGYLVNETTRGEREQIVKDSLGSINASCDGCMVGLAEMYQDYIEGKRELREGDFYEIPGKQENRG